MERTKKPATALSEQMKKKVNGPVRTKFKEYKGKFLGRGYNISTGSTLLDLAISGGRIRGGGLPAGILVEIFGPSGSGKTVLLSEIAGNVQAQGGQVMFHDPEARLNQQFAQIFGLELKEGDYTRPDTVPEVFEAVRGWKPKGKEGAVHGIMADSLAALSTDMEMDPKKGDKMGMRRPKEFSEQTRITCRELAKKDYLMVCSNQVRVNVDAGDWGEKYTTPGGLAIGFYASVRLMTKVKKRIVKEEKFRGKDISRIIGVEIEVYVYKNSVWKPFRSAPVTIIFDYGIDDIRQNLQFLKNFSKQKIYTIAGENLKASMAESIAMIEDKGLEEALKQEVILLWNKIEIQFDSHRKPKH
jgi:protein RecA